MEPIGSVDESVRRVSWRGRTIAFAVLLILGSGCASGRGAEASGETNVESRQSAVSSESSQTRHHEPLTVRVTWSSISVEGEQAVPLDDGGISAAYKQGGRAGMLIPAVKKNVKSHIKTHRQKFDHQPKLRIEVSPLTTYRRFTEVFYSATESFETTKSVVELIMLRPDSERVLRTHQVSTPELPPPAQRDGVSPKELESLPSLVLSVSSDGFRLAQSSEILEPVEGCSERTIVCMNQSQRGLDDIVDAARDARDEENDDGVRNALLELRTLYDFVGLYNLALSLNQTSLKTKGLQFTADPRTPMYVLSTAMAVLERKIAAGKVDGSEALFEDGKLWKPAPERGTPWVERFIASVAR